MWKAAPSSFLPVDVGVPEGLEPRRPASFLPSLVSERCAWCGQSGVGRRRLPLDLQLHCSCLTSSALLAWSLPAAQSSSPAAAGKRPHWPRALTGQMHDLGLCVPESLPPHPVSVCVRASSGGLLHTGAGEDRGLPLLDCDAQQGHRGRGLPCPATLSCPLA